MDKYNRKGFTLVELAIVIVIIGMLIGGTLTALSMVRTSKLQSVIREVQQYEVMVKNFKTYYGAVPGDVPGFPNPGNGDGKMFSAGTVCDDLWGNPMIEHSNFWVHLGLSEFGPPGLKFTLTIPPGQGLDSTPPDVNVPALEFSPKANLLVLGGGCKPMTNPLNGGETFDETKIHFLITDMTLNPNLIDDVKPVFTPAEADSLDRKMDDGMPIKGVVRGSRDTDCVVNATLPAAVNSRYKTSSTAAGCELSILMGSQVVD